MDRGFIDMYITIEGADATGKSSQCKLLANVLEDEGHSVFLTKEPGSPHDSICSTIKQILLDPTNDLQSRAALFLFLADRSQHMSHVKLALQRGQIVISDRSSLSTFVYHIAELRDEVRDEDQYLCNILDFAQQISPDLCFVC